MDEELKGCGKMWGSTRQSANTGTNAYAAAKGGGGGRVRYESKLSESGKRKQQQLQQQIVEWSCEVTIYLHYNGSSFSVQGAKIQKLEPSLKNWTKVIWSFLCT